MHLKLYIFNINVSLIEFHALDCTQLHNPLRFLREEFHNLLEKHTERIIIVVSKQTDKIVTYLNSDISMSLQIRRKASKSTKIRRELAVQVASHTF